MGKPWQYPRSTNKAEFTYKIEPSCPAIEVIDAMEGAIFNISKLTVPTVSDPDLLFMKAG